MIHSKDLKILITILLFTPILHGQPHLSRLAGFYTLANGKGTNLTISPIKHSLILRKENGTLLVKRDKHFETSVFETQIDKKIYTLTNKNDLRNNQQRIEVSITEARELYLDICNEETKIEKLDIEIAKILKSSIEADYAATIIDPSCKQNLGAIDFLRLRTKVKEFFTEASPLYKCLSSVGKNNDSLKDKGIADSFLHLVSGYENDRALLKNSKSPTFSIKCEKADDPSSRAKFFDNTITLPTSGGKIKIEECQTLDSTLSHEYMHKTGIKDENLVHAVEKTCMKFNATTSTSEVACNDKSSKVNVQSELRRNLEVNQNIDEVLNSQQAKLTPIVQKELEKAPIKEVKVSDATWSSLANDPNATIPTAERNSIAATMNSNFESMSGSLNRALGATQTPALAANESPASSSSGSSSASSETTGSGSGSRSPASSYERAERETYSSDNSKNSRGSRGSKESTGPSNEFHTVEEYIVDSKNAKDPRSFNIPGTRQGASAGRGQDQSVAATPRQGMSATTSTGENPTENSQVTNAGRARNSEIARSASGGEFAGGDVSSGGTSSLPAQGSGSGPAPARGSNRRQPASQGGGSSSNAFNGGNSVSSLKEQTLIRGSDYESITSNYRRRDFSNELHQQGVSIYVEKQGMSLGRSDAKIKFIDNGEYLRRAEGN